MNILDYIPKGRNNAISRQDLEQLTGLSDRAIRKEIKKLVQKGIPILSSSQSKGYWYSDDIEELENFIKESKNRCRTEYLTVRALEKTLYEAKNIKVVPVRQHLRKISNGDLDGQQRIEVS